jgi:hypothetical protein
MDQTISDLTEKELGWLSAQKQAAVRFVNAMSLRDAGQPVSLAGLDRAFGSWMASEPSGAREINDVINAVGVTFGEFLVENAGLRWVIATDEHGSDLAVFGLPGKGDVLVYPANLVAKRWERRESNFLENVHREIVTKVHALAAKVPAKRPWWKFGSER